MKKNMLQRLVLIWWVCLLVLVSLVGGCKAGAVFNVSDLTVEPSAVWSGDPAVVSVVVHNIGDREGKKAVTIEVDGVAEETQEVNLAAGEAMPIVFSVTEEAGVHNVSINGLTGSFVVKRIEPLVIVAESIPPVKLYNVAKLGIHKTTGWPVSETHTLRATGGVPPYSWNWEFPEEILYCNKPAGSGYIQLCADKPPCSGSPCISIVFNPHIPSDNRPPFRSPSIPWGGEGRVVFGLLPEGDLSPEGKIPGVAYIWANEFIDPVFYPEKVVKIPVTIRVVDSKGNLATRKFTLGFTMAK